ncbi:hypothetical protein K493DRAFT_383316 [Basidiobolus meristosporus CBS 931.73]|uniref:DUF3533 domain-containing protein n=1 Tax=Basidiobolus meristosporus CBS 931.73 TaxID=1314790 RepID=A0A1Y1XU41_9FUNG|nr:hypothetical protein K493DRAFT_383316 [Basidiobolus meristosporus CBS 931.73]|eukprot:ORX89233.1 hypothetical protein K493DRAFT_383316 [Basidiobolus meristosporus CBS 931.73]
MSNEGATMEEKTVYPQHGESNSQLHVPGSVEAEQSAKKPTRSFRQLFPQYVVLPHLITNSFVLVGFIIFLVTLCYQWIYAGFLWNPLGRVSHLEVALVNQDTGFNFNGVPTEVHQLMLGLFSGDSAGKLVSSTIMNPALPLYHALTWSALPDSTTREEAIETLNHGDYWALLYIPSNFSQNFLSATNAATRQSWEVEWIFDQGRNYNTQSFLRQAKNLAFDAFSSSLAKQFLTSKAGPMLTQAMDPMLWVDFLKVRETVLHPVRAYGSNFASYVAFVVSYIGCLLTVTIVSKFLRMREVSRSWKFPAVRVVMAWGFLAAVLTLFQSISIMIPSVSLANNQFEWRNAGYAIAFVWYTSFAFLSILFLMAILLSAEGFQVPGTLLLVLQLTTSDGIISNVLQPGLAKVGLAFPMYYGVRGLRSIFYGSLTHTMWINWLVITAWIVVPGLLSMILARYKLRRLRHENNNNGKIGDIVASEDPTYCSV